MNDYLVSRLWLANVASTAQRAVLGTLAWHADDFGTATTTAASIAAGAGLSVRSARTHLDALAEAGWITITRARSLDGRHNSASTFQLGGALDPRNGQAAILTAPQLPLDTLVGRAAGLRFDPDRVGPAWSWRAPSCGAPQRVVLASMALLSDSRGVCLAPRPTIAARSLLSRRSTDRVVAELEAKGWVGRETRRRGQRAAEARLSFTRSFLALAHPKPPSTTASSDASHRDGPVLDVVQDGDDLRQHLAAAVAAEWVGPEADLLAALITDWATQRTRALVARRVALSADEAIADIITLAWIALRECAGDILGARNPWGLLATIVSRRAASQDEIDRGVVDLGRAGKVQAYTTVDDDRRLDAHTPVVDQQLRGTELGLDDLADAPAMDMLVGHLASVGVDPGLAWPVLCRCVEISLSAQNSRRHTIARADHQLAALGLTPDQATAWMNMITGTRRLGQQTSALANIFSLPQAIPKAWLDAITAA